MPVAQCSGATPCTRLISISQVPGGNPAAKADPEGYASAWTLCACRAYTCDRCLGRQQGKCRCGAPARLFTEDERIQIARGGPLPAGGAAAPPHGPLSARAVPAGPVAPVRPALEGIAMQIEFELGRNNLERARAMANLAANGMAQQGQNAPADEVPWIMRFGESFYRWRFYAEGAQFWKGVFQLLKKHGHAVESKESLTAIASNGAFQVLSGELTSAAPHAFSTVAMIEKSFGPDHVLTREVKAKIGPLQPPTTPAAPQVPAAPAQPRPSPMAASYDAPTKLALWVTLAFLDVAMADGKTDDAEYLAWKNTMARMQLPDVWTRFGLQGLADMLKKGMLHELSVEFLGHPADERAKLAGTLVEFMLADGRMEPSEIEAVRRISGWLGVSIEIGGPAPGAAAPAAAAPAAAAVPDQAIIHARCPQEIEIYLDLKAPGCDRAYREGHTAEGPVTIVECDDDPPKTFTFRVAYPQGQLGAGGVPGPSQLVQPSDFLVYADVYSRRVPASPQGLTPEKHAKAKKEITLAAQYVEEVMKFIPPGASDVPAQAFVTEGARGFYAKEPGRFNGARLAAVAQAYRGVAARF